MSLYAGFDLGGTRLKYGLIDERGQVVFNDKSATPPSMDDLISLLRKTWEILKRSKNERIAAAGFGFPGIFSTEEQKIFQSPNYPEIDNFDLIPTLSRFVEVPFWIDNDANMATFGEFKRGAGQGVQSMILLTIGTGIGSGIILEGKLWHGKCGFAGELGHVIVNPNGERCNCGSRGCLETESSAPKIAKNYKNLTKIKEDITAEDVYRRAKKGDQAAREAFAQAGFYLGIGLASTINFINPEKILLGGAVTAAGDFLLSPALKEARKRTYKASYECCSIEKATLGNKAGFIGSAFWAKTQLNK